MTEAETRAFKAGYLLACCNLVHSHDRPDLASDVLGEADIAAADVADMDLTDFDAKALAEIRAARPNADPLR